MALKIINQSVSIKKKFFHEHVFWTGLKLLIHHPLYIYQQLTTFNFKFQIPNRLSFQFQLQHKHIESESDSISAANCLCILHESKDKIFATAERYWLAEQRFFT